MWDNEERCEGGREGWERGEGEKRNSESEVRGGDGD